MDRQLREFGNLGLAGYLTGSHCLARRPSSAFAFGELHKPRGYLISLTKNSFEDALVHNCVSTWWLAVSSWPAPFHCHHQQSIEMILLDLELGKDRGISECGGKSSIGL